MASFLRFAEAELTTQGVRHPKVTATGLPIGHTEPLPEGFKAPRKKPANFILSAHNPDRASKGGQSTKRKRDAGVISAAIASGKKRGHG